MRTLRYFYCRWFGHELKIRTGRRAIIHHQPVFDCTRCSYRWVVAFSEMFPRLAVPPRKRDVFLPYTLKESNGS